jgi:enoyl-CoA hydratase
MAFETIVVEISEHIALIKLNRPDALNALNTQLLAELCTALEDADANDKVRCVVLTGSEKAFAAGADIKEMSSMSFADVNRVNLFAEASDRIIKIRKPIIAAVSGYALGGGCELAMACDFIIASDTAKFGQPEINLGVIAGMGGSQRLTRFVGKSKAMDMNLTGRFMDADEAERSGLVSRVVPGKKLLDEAMGAAAKDRREIADKRDGCQRSGEPQLRADAGRGFVVRTPGFPFAVRDRRPERGHGRLHGKARGAIPR